MKKINLKKNGEEGYWKSFTDIMAGLLLVILLILMLLLLYLSQMDVEQHEKDHDYDQKYYGQDDDDDDHQFDEQYKYPEPPHSGGGGGGVDEPGNTTHEGIYIDVGHGKTAVFVTVVDEETKNVIKKEGILFELYAKKNASGGLCRLHSYYPEKIEYKQFQTTEEGTFYLPEKISLGWYSFHNLKAPEGYGLAENVNFEITEELDWSEPYLVKIPMSPVKGKICIQDADAETGVKVTGQKYEIKAAEDIVTLDETVRYRKGDIVDTVTCDDTGYAESKKLYLGKYTVTRIEAAEYYVLDQTPFEAEIKEESLDKVYKVKSTKTKVELKLTDSFSGQPIEGAVYTVTDKKEMTTDENGSIVITDLNKDTQYKIKVKSLPELYRTKKTELSFNVSTEGMVSGKAESQLKHEAYIVRLTVDVRDMLFKSSCKGKQVRLMDESGTVVDEWQSADAAHVCEGLEPGTYTVEVTGLFKSSFTADVIDNPEPSAAVHEIWTLLDTLAVAGGIILFILAVFLSRKLIKKLKEKHAEKKAAKEAEKASAEMKNNEE